MDAKAKPWHDESLWVEHRAMTIQSTEYHCGPLHIPEFSTGRTETIGADRAMIGTLFDIVSVTSKFRPARASGIGACATVPTRVFAAPQR